MIVCSLTFLSAEELVQKVEECHKYFGNDDFMTYAGEKAHLELGIEPVISHGDMWANNIIFETDKDNNLTGNVVGIIDWQLVNFGMFLFWVKTGLISVYAFVC